MPKPKAIGWAHTHFGRSDCVDLEGLVKEVVPAALVHAGVLVSDIDGVFLGTYNNGFLPQTFEAGLVGMAIPELRYVPAARLESACATGSAALYAALDFIASGRGKIALVIGAEKMTMIPAKDAAQLMLHGSYLPEESHFENGFAGVFASIAESYFQKYGNKSIELAMIAAKNHYNAVSNPFAHIRKDIGFDFCNNISDQNPYVVAPLRRTDCSPISDGAAALVIAAPDVSANTSHAVSFRAYSQFNDFMALSRRDVTQFSGAAHAWSKSLTEAGLTLNDLSLVETHDCFTIAELIEYEVMGLAEPGQGDRIIREGITTREGRLPVNLSGGLKARGHPLGATGVSQHVMAAMQLVDEAGSMQLPGATIAGVFNMGGAAVTNYATILERIK